ncbi:hypothetical protein Bbelb_050310 [Branchiostoma belcheri]|nr:hypothetical protein Bbelb_050310 [Branchiostoma belcheri]
MESQHPDTRTRLNTCTLGMVPGHHLQGNHLRFDVPPSSQKVNRYWRGTTAAQRKGTRKLTKSPKKFGPARKLGSRDEFVLVLMKLRLEDTVVDVVSLRDIEDDSPEVGGEYCTRYSRDQKYYMEKLIEFSGSNRRAGGQEANHHAADHHAAGWTAPAAPAPLPGKDDRLPPEVRLPGVDHSESHWSNASTMDRYADKVPIPYVTAQREALGLSEDQPALAIFDVFKAHRCPELLAKLKENHIHAVFVPASCTGELQPLDYDGGVNDVLKKELKQRFVQYYADKFTTELQDGRDLASISVDMTLSKLKPIHANWVLGAMDSIANNVDAIARGWDRTGIRGAVSRAPVELLLQAGKTSCRKEAKPKSLPVVTSNFHRCDTKAHPRMGTRLPSHSSRQGTRQPSHPGQTRHPSHSSRKGTRLPSQPSRQGTSGISSPMVVRGTRQTMILATPICQVAEAGELQGEAVQAEESETPQDWVQCNSCLRQLEKDHCPGSRWSRPRCGVPSQAQELKRTHEIKVFDVEDGGGTPPEVGGTDINSTDNTDSITIRSSSKINPPVNNHLLQSNNSPVPRKTSMASLRAELEAWKRRALAAEGKLQRDTVIMVKTKLSPQQVTELQRLCLKTTYFKYEGKFSSQVEGAAMGSPVSPIVANLFINPEADQEELLLHPNLAELKIN